MAAVYKSDLKDGESLGEYMNRMTNKTARKSSPSKTKPKTTRVAINKDDKFGNMISKALKSYKKG